MRSAILSAVPAPSQFWARVSTIKNYKLLYEPQCDLELAPNLFNAVFTLHLTRWISTRGGDEIENLVLIDDILRANDAGPDLRKTIEREATVCRYWVHRCEFDL